MDPEVLKEAKEKLKSELTGFIDEKIKEAQARFGEGLGLEDVKRDITNALQRLKEITDLGLEGKVTELENHLNEAVKSMKGLKRKDEDTPESFQKELTDKLKKFREDSKSKSLLDYRNHGLTLDFIEKAVGDMGPGNVSIAANSASSFAGSQAANGVRIEPLYDNQIRPYLPTSQTERDSILYIEKTAMEGGFTTVAPGALKPQIDWDLQQKRANVTKIAGHFRLPEEMIDDIPYLLNYLINRGTTEYRNAESGQLLYGDGTGTNLSGLFTLASAFAAGGFADKFVTPTEFDVLVAAKTQLRKLNLRPSVIFVNPEDWAKMRLMKTTTGEYQFPILPGTNIITIDGTPVVDNNRVTADNFMVADARWCEIVDRKGLEIRLFEQDRDNPIRNLTTVVIEGRLAFPVYRPSAFVKGTFTAAMADLLKP